MNLITKVQWRLRWWKEKKILRVAPREANPFPTHLPVLLSLARWLPIRRVLELGCGDFSTMTFLNRQFFPDLEVLLSIENDSQWAEKIREKSAGDPRLNLRVVNGGVADMVASLPLEDFDLIFVDDSMVMTERARTIKTLAAHELGRPVVAIHDFEVDEYRDAAKEFTTRFRFTGITPNVGLCWNHIQLRRQELNKLNNRLRSVRRSFDTGDGSAWLNWLNTYSRPSSMNCQSAAAR